jgi:hypothetical protein
MATLTETGHAKNVANFEDLVQRLEHSEGKYMPSRQVLQLTNLKFQLEQAKASMRSVTVALPAYTAAVDARQAAWNKLDKLVTRALNVFKASVDDRAQTETAVSYAKKIRGEGEARSTKHEDGSEGPAPKTVSTSQQSFDLTAQNFDQFISLLEANPAYQPNEADLQAAALRSTLEYMRSLSNTVSITKAALDAARTQRNNMLYANGTGIVPIAMDVKTYVKGGFTPESVQYKPILGIRFTNYLN